MIISVDDSGDPGIKLGKGSSNFFLIAAVLFEDDLDAEETSLKIKRLRKELGWKENHEFKFRKLSPELRKKFLETVKNLNYKVIVFELDKSTLKEPKKYRNDSSKLYNAVILETIKSFGDIVKSVHIYIDGESGNDYRRKVKSYFRKNLPKNAMRELSYQDSKKNNLIQLADMIVGAARRKAERGEDEYIKIVRKRIIEIKQKLA